MFRVGKVLDKGEKSVICEGVLRALPDWFGIEEAIIEYVSVTKEMPFYAAWDGDKPIGFVAAKVHNPYTAEVYVMGVLEEYHGKGIGKDLARACEKDCTDQGIEFLTVKTLDESAESKGYEITRQFYRAMGFKPLEVFTQLWDESNPCLFMAKYIG